VTNEGVHEGARLRRVHGWVVAPWVHDYCSAAMMHEVRAPPQKVRVLCGWVKRGSASMAQGEHSE
jgi:hypothetical protein